MEIITNEKNKHKQAKLKWLILLLNILANFSSYYCTDSVGVLHDSLKEKFKNLGNEFEFYFNLMYAVYSFPNIILPLIGGIVITKYGSSIMYFIFGLLILIGQIVFACGIFYDSIYTVLIGRFVFGLGGECLGLPQNSMIVKWFPKAQLGLPLGLSVSGGRIASVLNDLITPYLAAKYNCNLPIRIGMFISIASFTFTIINIFVDKKGEEIYELKKDKGAKENLNKEFYDSVVIAENTSFRQLPAIYWLTCLFIIFCYGTYMPFNNIASGFLTETFFKDLEKQEAETKAGIYMSIPFAISCFCVPLFGHLVDKFGKRASITLLSSLLGVFGFASFFFLEPVYGFIIIGFSYSLTATVCWNIISVVVKTDAIALAIGIVSSLANTILVINPIIVAAIYSRSPFICAILIYLEDMRNNSQINKSNLYESVTENLQTPSEDIFDNQLKVSMIKSAKL